MNALVRYFAAAALAVVMFTSAHSMQAVATTVNPAVLGMENAPRSALEVIEVRSRQGRGGGYRGSYGNRGYYRGGRGYSQPRYYGRGGYYGRHGYYGQPRYYGRRGYDGYRPWRYDYRRHGYRYPYRRYGYGYYYDGWWYASPFWTVPFYYAPYYEPYYETPVYANNSEHVRYCLNKYRSYNPSTDRFLSYSGVYRRCRSPWRP